MIIINYITEMGKDEKKLKSERDRYIMTQPVEAYKQQIAKEERVLGN